MNDKTNSFIRISITLRIRGRLLRNVNLSEGSTLWDDDFVPCLGLGPPNERDQYPFLFLFVQLPLTEILSNIERIIFVSLFLEE